MHGGDDCAGQVELCRHGPGMFAAAVPVVALSSVIGTVGLDSFGSAVALPVIAAVFVPAAAILTWLSSPADRRTLAAAADDMTTERRTLRIAEL